MLGHCAPRCTPYCARASSTRCTATRRSRLLTRASSISFCRRASRKNSHQPISSAGVAPCGATAAAGCSPSEVGLA
ncbi:Uncharacterised protein [Bordetella pertussis]|nr:Uncharacterised protein [Bordetella pertussis]